MNVMETQYSDETADYSFSDLDDIGEELDMEGNIDSE